MKRAIAIFGLSVAFLNLAVPSLHAQQITPTNGWLLSGGLIGYRVERSQSTFAGFAGSVEYGSRNGFGFVSIFSYSGTRGFYNSWIAGLDVGPSFGKAWRSTRFAVHAGASAQVGGDNDGGGGGLIGMHIGAGAWLQPAPRVVLRPGIQMRFSAAGYSNGSATLTLGVLL